MPRRGKSVPGSRNKAIPGSRSARLPAFNAGGMLTRTQRASSAGDWAALHRTQVRDSKGRFAGGVGFAWQGLDAAADAIVNMVDRKTNDVEAEMHKIAAEMVVYAQTNHPWANKTGAAEAGLQAKVVRQGETQWTIMLGHGPDVQYGLWLEVRDGGKYAIILPTLQYFAPRLGNAVVRPGTAN